MKSQGVEGTHTLAFLCAEEAVGARISFVTSPQAPAPLSGASRRSVVSSCVCVCVLVSKKTKQNVLQHADIRWFVLMWYLCLSKSEAPHGATQGKHMFPQGDHLTFQQKATLCPKKTSRWLVFTASEPCARPLLDAWNVCAVNLNRITTDIYNIYIYIYIYISRAFGQQPPPGF